MLQFELQNNQNNYFKRVLNKNKKNNIVWHSNCLSTMSVMFFTDFGSFSRRGNCQEKKLKI